ncbi:MAG: AsmA family protein, partial [Bacteroidota bacterium]
MLKKILKIAAWLFGIFLGLLLVIALLIQVPAVQNKIVQQVASTLSETLNTKVELRRVVLKPFKTLALKGVYLESQQQDTLVYAEEVGVNLSVLRLLKQRIHVREIYLEGAKIQLHRAQADSLFNYQFLIDAFASDQPKDTTASPSTWTFGLDEVSIQDSYFRMLDEYGYTDTEFTIQDFEVQMGDLDLEKQLVDINLIRLKNSSFRYAFLENEVEVPLVDSLVANTADASLAFPDLGWDVYLNRLSLVDNQVVFEDQNSQRIKNALDFEHLNLQDLNIEVRDVQWVEDLMKGKIKEIHFRDHSGFELEHFASNLKLDPRSGSIEKFELRTPNSVFKASATASFSQFSDLVNQLEEKVQFDLEIANARLTFKDLNYFAPSFTEIKQLNTKLERAMRLDGKVAGTLNDLQTIRVNFAVADDIVLKAKGKAQKVTDPDALTYDIQLQELATFYDKIKNLTRNVEIPSGLDSLGRIQLSGNFKGGMNKVRGKNIQFRTDAYTGFRGDLVARHLTDGQPIAFDLDIIEMRTQASDLNGFVEGGLPPEVARMGKMQYSGKIVGDVYNIDSKGQLNTEVGQLDTDARISFSQDYADASYRGQLALQQFNLGQVLQDTSIGKVSLEVEGAGSGLAVDSLQAEFNGRIVAFDYLDYEYHD